MENKKAILVAYTSKGGATEQAAQIIAEVLKDKCKPQVDLADLRKKSPILSRYSNIVIGGGVRAGKVYGEALNLLKEDLSGKKVAFFVCCGGAGDPKNYEDSCKKYVTDVLAKFPNVETVAAEAFGGRMKVLGKTVFDNVDPAKIRAWAETVGEKFAK